MTRAVVLLVAFLAVLWAAPSHAGKFTFAAVGDMPYGPNDLALMKTLMDRLNRENPAFIVHVGDVKMGWMPCGESYLDGIKAEFDRSAAPVIYTPGDNEWSDCGKKDKSLTKDQKRAHQKEQLKAVRRVFFPLGRNQDGSPSAPIFQSADYPENQRWETDGVLFVTLHVVGGGNNEGDEKEFRGRQEANVQWLEAAMDAGTSRQALVVIQHADPKFKKKGAFKSEFRAVMEVLQKKAVGYPRPILLVHGDGHKFRIDMPLRTRDGRQTIDTLTRLEVFGAWHVQGVLVRVDTDKSYPFAFSPVIVPGNTKREH